MYDRELLFQKVMPLLFVSTGLDKSILQRRAVVSNSTSELNKHAFINFDWKRSKLLLNASLPENNGH